MRVALLMLMVMLIVDHVVVLVMVVLVEEGVLEKLERVQDAHRALHHLLAAGVDVHDVVGTGDSDKRLHNKYRII